MGENTPLAFVFPGQGSQKVGMLAVLAAEEALIKETFEEASQVLGYNLWQLVENGPQESLNMTEKTQPALLTASVAIWKLWCLRDGKQPAFMAGHSLGEWSALVCAGVISFADAVRLVRLRGQYMQEAVPAGEGAMAAIIGLDDKAVNTACAGAETLGEVAAVNFNSPGQVVIAGARAAVEAAMVTCKESGARSVVSLPVSAPFHTKLMQPAAERLALDIQTTPFSTPSIPVIHNVHAKTESDPTAIQNLMIEQIYSPVLWVDCVRTLAEFGVTDVVECGPGKVLSGLIKRIDRQLSSYATDTTAGFTTALTTEF